jgi:hypothetical protein
VVLELQNDSYSLTAMLQLISTPANIPQRCQKGLAAKIQVRLLFSPLDRSSRALYYHSCNSRVSGSVGCKLRESDEAGRYAHRRTLPLNTNSSAYSPAMSAHQLHLTLQPTCPCSAISCRSR